jgi:hypothetical protein
MKQFDIFIRDRPGELAKVAEALAARAINIKAIASERANERPFVRIVTNDEQSTRAALEDGRLQYQETEIMTISLLDRPGELAKVAKKLGKAGININSIYILERERGITTLAVSVDDISRAKTVLRK